jgi:hypothetical protein
VKHVKCLLDNNLYNLYVFVLITFLSSLSFAQKYIDPNKTLFGIEYTFQDAEMLREPGRNTMSTPYKQQKILEMLEVYLHKKNWTEDVLTPKTGLKEGWFINTPDDGRYVINAEPVTIEFNTTPKTVYQIIPTARPIYESAKAVGLVPYVNSAAERSGLGAEMYVQGSLAAIERITGVARMSKMLPGVVLVLRQRRSRDEHSKIRKTSTKPFARRKPFSDQRPPSKNAPRL